MSQRSGESSETAGPDRLASAALILACLFWSGNFIAGRAFRDVLDPEMLSLLRWSVAAVAFLPVAGAEMLRHRRVLWNHKWWVLGLALSGVIGFQQATYTALTQTPVANAVLLLATTPVMILASSAVLGANPLVPRQWMAVVLSLTGVSVILGDGDPLAVLRLELGPGDLWLLLAVACWTAYTQLLRQTPRDLPGGASLLASILVALPLLLPLALWQSEAHLVALPPMAWAGIAYVGLGAALMAFLAWGYGVRRKGPNVAGLYLNLMPVFSISLAFVLLGEHITIGQVFGALLIVASLVLGTYRTAA